MVIHLGIQDALGERPLQAVEKSVRIEGRLRIGPRQQLVQDGIRNMRLFASRHGWAPFHPSCPPTHEIPDSLVPKKSTEQQDIQALHRKRHVLTDTGDGRSRIDAVQEDSLSGSGNEPMMASPSTRSPMAKMTASTSVPKSMQATYEAITSLTDAFC